MPFHLVQRSKMLRFGRVDTYDWLRRTGWSPGPETFYYPDQTRCRSISTQVMHYDSGVLRGLILRHSDRVWRVHLGRTTHANWPVSWPWNPSSILGFDTTFWYVMTAAILDFRPKSRYG